MRHSIRKEQLHKLVNPSITHISLCPAGKNRMRTLFKEDGAFELQGLSKADEEGLLTAVVYAPNTPDADGHFADPETIAQMAKEYVRDHRNVDLRHDMKPLAKEDAYLAASWIITKSEVEHPEGRFHGMKDDEGAAVDPTGGWAVQIQLEREDLRSHYRSEEWQGVSMAGTAQLDPVRKEDGDEGLFRRFLNFLGAAQGNDSGSDQDIDMKKEELTELFKEQTNALVEAIAKAISPGNDDDKDKDKAEDTFDGDPTDTAAVAKFAETKVRKSLIAKIEKGEDVEASLAKLQAMDNPEDGPSDKELGLTKESTPRERQLAKELWNERKRSSVSKSAPVKKSSFDEDLDTLFPGPSEDLWKEEDMEVGTKLADFINEQNGVGSTKES